VTARAELAHHDDDDDDDGDLAVFPQTCVPRVPNRSALTHRPASRVCVVSLLALDDRRPSCAPSSSLPLSLPPLMLTL